MIFAETICGADFSGHCDDDCLKNQFHHNYKIISEIQADGHELVRCCEILGRSEPSSHVYTFLGENAREIALNWF